MKLKKILASLTATALALTTAAVMPMTASATETKIGSFISSTVTLTADASSNRWDSQWVQLSSNDFSDQTKTWADFFTNDDAYLKISYSMDATTAAAHNNGVQWGVAQGWYKGDINIQTPTACVAYADNYECVEGTVFDAYVKFSGLGLTASNVDQWNQVGFNIQAGPDGTYTISAVDLVVVKTDPPVVPTGNVELSEYYETSTITAVDADWGVDQKSWNTNALSLISGAADAANYGSATEYLAEFDAIRYDVTVSSLSGDATFENLKIQPYVQEGAPNWTWTSGTNSTSVTEASKTFSVYMLTSQITANSYNSIGVQIYDDVNMTEAGDSSSISATIKPTLIYKLPTSITMDSEMALGTGETGTLTPSFSADATDDNVIWSSSEEAVATVDENGEVTAVAAGEAVITCALAADSDVTAECKVTVSDHISGVKLTPAAKTLYLQSGKNTVQLTASPVPADSADVYEISFSSSNPAVASVSADGLVTGQSEGTATITATLTTGGNIFTAASEITVEEFYVPAYYIDYGVSPETLDLPYTAATTDFFEIRETLRNGIADFVVELEATDPSRNIKDTLSSFEYTIALSKGFAALEEGGEYEVEVTVDVATYIDEEDVFYPDFTLGASGEPSDSFTFTLYVTVEENTDDDDDDDDDNDDDDDDDDDDYDDDDDDDDYDDDDDDDDNDDDTDNKTKGHTGGGNNSNYIDYRLPIGGGNGGTARYADKNTTDGAHLASALKSAKSGDEIYVLDSDGVLSAEMLETLSSKSNVTITFVFEDLGINVSVNSDDIDPNANFEDIDLSVSAFKYDVEDAVESRGFKVKSAPFKAIEKLTITVTFRGGSKNLDAVAAKIKSDKLSVVENGTVSADRTFAFDVTSGGSYVAYSVKTDVVEDVSAAQGVESEGASSAAETVPAAVAFAVLAVGIISAVKKARNN